MQGLVEKYWPIFINCVGQTIFVQNKILHLKVFNRQTIPVYAAGNKPTKKCLVLAKCRSNLKKESL